MLSEGNGIVASKGAALTRYGSEIFDERASLKLMKQYSRAFDSGYFQYSNEADRLMHPSLMRKVGAAMREALAKQTGNEVPTLSDSYEQMMAALGGMNVELGKLYNVHFQAGQAIRDLVELRSKRSLEVAGSYDKMQDLMERDQGLRDVLRAELMQHDLPLMERVQKKVGMTLLGMKLYGEMRMQQGFEQQALELETSVDRLSAAHNSHVDVFMTYASACEAANIMHEELVALGPSHIASVYLTAGTAMVHDRLRRVDAYNRTIKDCISARSEQKKKTQVRGTSPYSMRTNLTDFVSAFE